MSETTKELSTTSQNVEEAKVMFSDLKTTLMDNIKKVQDNANYIPQAKSINRDANAIIKLAKLQLDILKLENRANGVPTKSNTVEH